MYVYKLYFISINNDIPIYYICVIGRYMVTSIYEPHSSYVKPY